MELSDRFDDALAFAARLHRHQKRKGSNIPYVAHLLAVCSLVIENGGDEDQAIAGLLHDAAEDQGGETILRDIEARYGAAVARIVADCTDSWTEPRPPWRARKQAYLAALPSKPAASLLVSLADKTHNAGAILGDYRVVGEALWARFSGDRDGTLWYYASLRDIFEQMLPGRLASEFSRIVVQFPKGG